MPQEQPKAWNKQNLRRSKTKASFFRAFESGPRQGWAVARAVSSCANISSLSCSYPLKTIVSTASCLTGLEVSLRRAPKNYPSEGNFLEASRVNVELTVVQISWQENPTRTPSTFTGNLAFQANSKVCHLHTRNHSHTANDGCTMHFSHHQTLKNAKFSSKKFLKTFLLGPLKNNLNSSPHPPFCGHSPRDPLMKRCHVNTKHRAT